VKPTALAKLPSGGLTVARIKNQVARATTAAAAKAGADQAAALRHVLKALGAKQEEQNLAVLLRVEFECKLGELLDGMGEKRGGSKFRSETLEPLGIGKAQSHRAQLMCRVPEERRVAACLEASAAHQDFAASEIYRLAVLAERIERYGPSGTPPLPEGTYPVLYADPPWQYNDARVALPGWQGSAAAHHYATMPTDDICALPIASIIAPDAVLFCWATFPMLPDGLRVVAAWGFDYKTAIVWDKERPAFGNYHDASAELLLIATRGSCVPEDASAVHQVQRFPKSKHSAKPEEFRQLIEKLYPNGPRIELFRRGTPPEGWQVWGNEIAP